MRKPQRHRAQGSGQESMADKALVLADLADAGALDAVGVVALEAQFRRGLANSDTSVHAPDVMETPVVRQLRHDGRIEIGDLLPAIAIRTALPCSQETQRPLKNDTLSGSRVGSLTRSGNASFDAGRPCAAGSGSPTRPAPVEYGPTQRRITCPSLSSLNRNCRKTDVRECAPHRGRQPCPADHNP